MIDEFDGLRLVCAPGEEDRPTDRVPRPPGGRGPVRARWPPGPDAWAAPLRDWARAGCDGLVLRLASRAPRDLAPHWLQWCRERGIEAIGEGLLLVRRREGDRPSRLRALE